MSHTLGPWKIDEGHLANRWNVMHDVGLFYWTLNETKDNARLVAAAPDLLAACEATCATIEFRGKHALAVFDELAEDESNWRDGVEPYWLEVYDQNKAAISRASDTAAL